MDESKSGIYRTVALLLVGAILAMVFSSVLAPLLLWWITGTKQQLAYVATYSDPLSRMPDSREKMFALSFEGNEIDNPKFVVLTLKNTGNQGLESVDLVIAFPESTVHTFQLLGERPALDSVIDVRLDQGICYLDNLYVALVTAFLSRHSFRLPLWMVA